jgi:biopolymer transport protein ExbD
MWCDFVITLFIPAGWLIYDSQFMPGNQGGAPFVQLPAVKTRSHGEPWSPVARVKVSADGTLHHRGKYVPLDEYKSLFVGLTKAHTKARTKKGETAWKRSWHGGWVSGLAVEIYVDRRASVVALFDVIAAAADAGIDKLRFPAHRGRMRITLQTWDESMLTDWNPHAFEVDVSGDPPMFRLATGNLGLDEFSRDLESVMPRNDPWLLWLRFDRSVNAEQFLSVLNGIRRAGVERVEFYPLEEDRWAIPIRTRARQHNPTKELIR